MAEKQYIGIYLTGSGATVALVEPHGRVPRLQSCFRMSRPAAQAEAPVKLADEIARLCSDRQFFYESSAMALERGFYSQHKMRSQFTELPRIEETAKFDAEEALTVDTSTLAVTFDVLKVDETGSDLNIYAADKKLLSEILSEMQAAGIDPLVIEPDSAALARFLAAVLPQQERVESAYALLTASGCTIVMYPAQQETPHIRSFILPASGATDALVREMTLTIASLKLSGALKNLHVFDPQARVDFNLVQKRLQLMAEPFDLVSASGWSPALMDQDIEPLALAVACGAAMGDVTKDHKADFRHDFAPHLGRSRLLEKTVKVICLSLTFLVVALGIYFQLRVIGVNRARGALYTQFGGDYRGAMNTQKVPTLSTSVDKLSAELRGLKERNMGLLTAQGQETVTGLLTYMLEVINGLPASVDLQLDQIKVTPKNIVLTGSTNKPDSTLALFQKIGASQYLSYTSVNEAYRNGRDEFGVTILPKRKSTGAANASKN
jgi:hypothetical protein